MNSESKKKRESAAATEERAKKYAERAKRFEERNGIILEKPILPEGFFIVTWGTIIGVALYSSSHTPGKLGTIIMGSALAAVSSACIVYGAKLSKKLYGWYL